MIPLAYIREWSGRAPWPDLRQVEQDLIICRVLCDLFNSDELKGRIAFRGGTAIHKLLFVRPLRYSEDIDLVQLEGGAIGPVVDAVRRALSWLGKCRRTQAGHSMHLTYRFNPEAEPGGTLKLKVEINTREHEPLFGVKDYPFSMVNSWYQAETTIASFEAEEIFGTKLRALLQRQKNRDLFDLKEGLDELRMDAGKVIECFEHYLALQGTTISRANAEQIMLKKLNRSLTDDIAPLLPVGVDYSEDDAIKAFGMVWTQLIARISGEPWKRSEEVIDEVRQHIPNFLEDRG